MIITAVDLYIVSDDADSSREEIDGTKNYGHFPALVAFISPAVGGGYKTIVTNQCSST